jgi:CRISPR-associated protein Cas1
LKKSIYIFSSGILKREGNTLCLEGERGKKFVPVSAVSSLSIFGEVTVNKRLLEFLASNEITLHAFNYYGYYVGSFYPRTHYNSGYMTLKQCEHYLDGRSRVEIARRFVEGGIKNMLRNLKYYEARQGQLSAYIASLEADLDRASTCEDVETLMAAEGNARENCYNAFNLIISNPDFEYTQRERRPPKSRLDALISFGNSLLYVTILSEIYKTHLDPRIGFLHSTNYRRFSLNLDLAEIFKPIIVDRMIFTLVNKRMIDKSHFAKELAGVYLNARGRQTFVREYERRLSQVVTVRERKRCSYQRLIRLELYKLEKHLIGEKEYEPFVAQW